MNSHAIGLGDMSNNKYAAVMKELATGLVNLSKFLLPFFLIYQLLTNDDVSLFSLTTILVIFGVEVVYLVALPVSNAIFALVMTPFVAPFAFMNKVRFAQNIQTSLLVVFGVSVCFGSWFIAEYVVNYAYS